MPKILVFLAAAVFFLYGLMFLFFPQQALQFVVQGTVSSGSGVTDVRATYGGMSAGIGIVLYFLAKSTETLSLGLLAVSALMFGMAFGRIIGMVVDGDPNFFMYFYLALEFAVGTPALVLLKARTKLQHA